MKLKHNHLFIFLMFFLLGAGTATATVAVVSPNGADTLQAGVMHQIRWTTSGVNNVQIEYSTNNGTTWNFIANAPASQNFYNWTVPSTLSSNTARIRITNVDNNSDFDISNNTFFINRLELISPVGGEKYAIGSTNTISWVASTHIGTINISFSTNDGQSWTSITGSVNASIGTFTWVPTVPGNNIRMRLRENANPRIANIGSGFQVYSLDLITPNGGESYIAGETQAIQWSSNSISNVTIQFSSDNGGVWNSIATVPAASGSYNWLVPQIPTAQGAIRILDASDNAIQDRSLSVFTIQSITITSPNVTTGWKVGSTQAITWNSNLSGLVRIQTSIDGGATYTTVATVNASTATYNYTVPNTPTASLYFRIESVNNTSIFDVSNQPITIGDVNLVQPTSGEYRQVGVADTIQWNSTLGINTVLIEYSANGGSTWRQLGFAGSSSIGSNGYLWSPSISDTTLNGKIRISDAVTGLVISDSSDLFSVVALNIQVPNALSVYRANSNATIQWISSSGIGALKVEYSTDAGVSWSEIAASTDHRVRSQVWAIPNSIASNSVRIRLTDITRPSITATTSDFRVGSISLLAPNGGETLVGNNLFTVRWNASQNISNVILAYSTNNGVNWTEFAGVYPAVTGSASITVPNVSTANARFSVRDAASNTLADSSDASFTIAALRVLTPNGNEGLRIGERATITWTATSISTVRLEFSSDAGATWSPITGAENMNAGVGTFSWVVPGSATDQGLIRISSVENPAFFDLSDQVFKIGNITVVSPNGSEDYQSGTTKQISWSVTPNITTLVLELSTNNGVSWSQIASGVNSTALSYNWLVPSSVTSTARIRITDAANNNLRDTSNAAFAIRSLTLTSPNGGERFQSGTTRTITWSAGNVSNVRLEYTTNSGSDWNSIAASVPAGTQSYSWLIPNIHQFGVQVRITDADRLGANINDISDGSFVIRNLTLTSPNGGEVYAANSTQAIVWQNGSNISSVRLEYSTNNGINWISVIDATNADGSYSWNAPILQNSTMLVRISDVLNTAVGDTSDATFSVGTLALAYPNGGERLRVGQVDTIRWNTISSVTNVLLDYSTNDGVSWNTINNGNPVSSALQQYAWTVPNTPSDNVVVRVRDNANALVNDISNNVFTISSITVTAPNGGEVMQSGALFPITWNAAFVSTVTLAYSSDGGVQWNTIGSVPAGDGTFNWTVPAVATVSGLVRVSDATASNVFDNSNSTFRIVNLRVSSPNGGEIIQAGSTVPITWVSGGTNSVRIEYSTDNGTTWQTISASTPAAGGTFNWPVSSSISSSQMLIAITSVDVPGIRDVSDAQFKVGSVQFLSPVLYDTLQSGRPVTINWSGSSSVTSVNLEYSVDDGATWNVIQNGVTSAGTNSFLWSSIPPGLSSNVGRIRVYDNASVNIASSSSRINFVNLNLTSPNGGEVYSVGSTQNINWSGSSLIDSIRVDLSTNGGNSWSTIVNSAPVSAGTAVWNIPANTPLTTNARLRVITRNNRIFDVSDASFSLANLQISSPSISTQWQAGTTQSIQWSSTNLQNVRIDYSINNGSSWSTIINSVAASASTYSWQIPSDLATSTALIRITSVETPAVQVVSSLFSIKRLDITSPIGGEFWKSGTQNLITYSYGNVSNVRIDFSTNNGNSWNVITASTPVNSAGYTWTPNAAIGSDSVRIRLMDASNSSVRDSSGSNFAIKNLTVTTPNGGEQFYSGQNVTVSWTATPNVTAVNVELSTNNGVNWSTLASNITNIGSYLWSIASMGAVDSALIRVSDAAAGVVVSDASNGVFKINSLRLLSPNGGETFIGGGVTQITWSSSPSIAAVRLDYSTDGVNWTLINASVPAASGVFDWSIPQLASTTLRLRIMSTLDNTLFDTTDATFKVGSLVLTSPNTNDRWLEGTVKRIQWSASSNVTRVDLSYSLDNGLTYTPIPGPVDASAGFYDWRIPANSVTQLARVRIIESQNLRSEIIGDTSNVFTISRLDFVTPAGGENFIGGATQTVRWLKSNDIVGHYLFYSTNAGTNWVLFDSVGNVSSYNWLMPVNITSNTMRLRIADTRDLTLSDTSAVFSISAPALTITAPATNQIVRSGTPLTIRWASQNVNSYRVEYSLDNATTWSTIGGTLTAGTDSIVWNIPDSLSSSQAFVRVLDANRITVGDTAGAFIIRRISLLSPNGGEQLQVGNTYPIRWAVSSDINLINIEYSSNNGAAWSVVSSSLPANTGRFDWLVSSSQISNNAVIRISDQNASTINDVSSAVFRVASLSVLSPNGGERLQAGVASRIQWTASSNVSTVNILYSVGGQFIPIANSVVNTGNYNWLVPSILGSQTIKILVVDAQSNSSISDSSDAVFSVSRLLAIAPTGGSQLRAGTSTQVQWQNSSDIVNINIEYSIDSARTWLPVITNQVASTGFINWSIPINLTSTNAFVRVTDASNASIADTSERFTIFSTTLDLISLTGGEFLSTGKSYPIRWNSSFITNVGIQYSLNDGATWFDIRTSVNAADGQFLWSVDNNLVTNTARIRIYDAASPQMADSSASSIKIGNVSLLSPNGGETYPAGGNRTITWSASANVNSVNLYYKTGSTWIPIVAGLPSTPANYVWSVPNIQSSSASLRIEDAASNGNIDDTTNNRFNIVSLQLISPNGGEIWQSNGNYTIQWQPTTLISSLRIDLTTDNGASWRNITPSISANQGSFDWRVDQGLSTDQARIRIANTLDTSVNAVSQQVFRISSIQVTRPNEVTKLLVGSAYTVQWNISNNIGSVDVLYSVDSGKTFIPIPGATGIPVSQSSVTWTIPDEPSNKCLIQIRAGDNSGFADTSDQIFTIARLTLTAPVAGKVLQTGKFYDVRWEGAFVDTVFLQYSINDDDVWATMPGSLNALTSTGVFSWLVPDNVTPNLRIRVVDARFQGINDESNQTYTIASLRVTAPAAVQSWRVATTQNVRWQSQLLDNVRIQLSTDNGLNWTSTLGTFPAATGSADVLVPDVRSPQAMIRVVFESDETVNDTADARVVVGDYPRLTSRHRYQRDTIKLQLVYDSPQELVSLIRFEYRTTNGTYTEATSQLIGNYTNLTGPLNQDVTWNSGTILPDYEGTVSLRLRFRSGYGVDYEVIIDDIGIDNAPPRLVTQSFTANQNPMIPEIGWSRTLLQWSAAGDTSLPVTYRIYVTDSTTYSAVPTGSTSATTYYAQNLKTATNYSFRIDAVDALGNSVSATRTLKTYAPADFNGDNRIDATDLNSFITSWVNFGTMPAADLAPFSDSIPFIKVKGNGRTDVEDILVFAKMWNFDRLNDLPKYPPMASVGTFDAERLTLNLMPGSNKISIPLTMTEHNVTVAAGLLSYDPSEFDIDSVRIESKIAQLPISLVYHDTTQGTVEINFADIGRLIPNDATLYASITPRKQSAKLDSLMMDIRGYDKDNTQRITKSLVYAVQSVPTTYSVSQNYPNPFNPSTSINYELPEKSSVRLVVYDALGQEVTTLINQEQQSGRYTVVFDSGQLGGLSSGVYLYRFTAGKFSVTRKMVLLK